MMVLSCVLLLNFKVRLLSKIICIFCIFLRSSKVLMIMIVVISFFCLIILLLNGNELTACQQIFILFMMNIQWRYNLYSLLMISLVIIKIIISLWAQRVVQYFIRWVFSISIFHPSLIILILIILFWLLIIIQIRLQFILQLTLLLNEIFHFSEFFL